MEDDPRDGEEKELLKRKLEVIREMLGGGEELPYLLEEDYRLFLAEYRDYLMEGLKSLGVEVEEGEIGDLEGKLIEALEGNPEFDKRLDKLKEYVTGEREEGREGGEPAEEEEKPPEVEERGESSEEPPRAGRKEAPRGRAFKGWLKPLVAGILALIVIGAVYYGYTRGNGQKKEVVLLPYIDASATVCDAGETVTLDATRTFIRSNVKEIELTWIILPENYRIVKGDLNSSLVKLYFTHSGKYNVTLLATYGETLKDYSISIDVRPITITVERLRWGDEYHYYTEGNVSLQDSEGIEYLSEEGVMKITGVRIHFKNPAGEEDVVTLDGGGEVRSFNGFGESVESLKVHLNQHLELSGEAEVNGGEGVVPIEGQQIYQQDKYVDLYYRNPLRVVSDTYLDVNFLLSGQSITRTYSIDEVEYPSTALVDVILSLEAVKEGRDFGEGEEGFFTLGGYTYQWKIVGTERVGERPCFKMEIYLEKALLKKLGAEEYQITLWLGNYVPVPVMFKTYLNATEGSTTYSVEIQRTLAAYQPGDSVVLFGEQSAYHPLVDDISQISPEYGGEKRSYDGLNPGQGSMSSSIPGGFTLDDVFDVLEGKSRYRQFMALHPSARLAYANISEEGPSMKKWELLLKDPESDDALKVLVLQSSPDTPVIVDTTSDLNMWEKPEEVYSFSAVESLAKECFDVENVTKLLYGKESPGENDELLWNGLTFRFTSYYPLLPSGVENLMSEKGCYYSFEKDVTEGEKKYVIYSAGSGALQSYVRIREIS